MLFYDTSTDITGGFIQPCIFYGLLTSNNVTWWKKLLIIFLNLVYNKVPIDQCYPSFQDFQQNF